jgi:hypothetical protein
MRDFIITARVKEYYEVVYRHYDTEIERVEQFILEEDAQNFVHSGDTYILSFVKVTDMMPYTNKKRY